jgi:hypothetical protein
MEYLTSILLIRKCLIRPESQNNKIIDMKKSRIPQRENSLDPMGKTGSVKN